MTGNRDVDGLGITGCGPVSAAIGIRAGTPHAVNIAAAQAVARILTARESRICLVNIGARTVEYI
ncbi:MAG TPA: hypothetical protein VF105_08410 [Gemmatimonadaceae bacterium]